MSDGCSIGQGNVLILGPVAEVENISIQAEVMLGLYIEDVVEEQLRVDLLSDFEQKSEQWAQKDCVLRLHGEATLSLLASGFRVVFKEKKLASRKEKTHKEKSAAMRDEPLPAR